MKTRKQIIEEYASKGYTLGTFDDVDVQCKCCEYSKNNYKVLYEFLSSQA